ncbi:hypothetical protein [Corynebacterium tuscaniense]|uniref:hypothetical protein n=1 Tax=Corynebacterium tuscaniense TaxID=302449 RepID=UPI0011AF77E3|nr:hypothetical protein [Corynebacterium tuscaniense]
MASNPSTFPTTNVPGHLRSTLTPLTRFLPASKRLIGQDIVSINSYEIETADIVSAVYRDADAGIWWD